LSSDEIVDHVDEQDNVLERRPLRECVELGLLHRAIVVILLDSSEKQVYLQRRAESKSFYPGFWSASCTGHVSSGESYHSAALREVREELGLVTPLRELFKFLSPKWKNGERIEWEYIGVFEGNTNDQKIILQEEEVQEGKYVTLDALADLIRANVDNFTPDSVIAYKRYYRMP
jgi:isopentenyl-diphosphate Delta-isomerase